MSSPISSLLGVSSPIAPSRVSSVSNTGSNGFGSALASAIENVDQQQQQATQSIQSFLEGKGELHNVAMTTQKAEIAFDLGLQIRNKVVSAYQEIIKMQL